MGTSSDTVRQAIEAARAGRKVEARDLLLQVVESDPHNELAWVWLSGLVDSLEDRIIACENALTINSSNEKVRAYLTQLQQKKAMEVEKIQPTAPPQPKPAPSAPLPIKEDPMKMAARFEQEGRYKEAIEVYKAQAARTKNSQEFDHIYKQIVRIENLQEENIRHVPPALTIARLTATWPIVYFIFMLLHEGFNPIAHMEAILCLGLPVVIAGSFLLAVSEIRSNHAIWKKLFDEDGDGSRLARLIAAGAGWLLVIFPHLLILLSALNRLRHFIVPPEPF